MDTQSHPLGPSGSKSSWLGGSLSNTSLIGIQQECWSQLVHLDAANAATKYTTQDAHLNMVCRTGSRTNKLQHAVECEYINTVVNGRQFTVYHTPGVSCELPYQCIAASNGKPPWSTKAFLCTVCESEHDVVVSSRMLVDEFPNEHPRESTKKDLITL
jgi:hypothetical protein